MEVAAATFLFAYSKAKRKIAADAARNTGAMHLMNLEKARKMLAVQIIVGIVLGLMLFLATFAITTPLFIGFLVNRPNEAQRGIPLFTFPEEGKVKLIVRGDRLIRMVMLFAGHKFKRDASGKTRDDSEYWEIVEGKQEDPTDDITPFLRPWAKYVYELTGAVFTGIYPFQQVRVYQLEKTKIIRDESNPEKESNLLLDVIHSESDHLRTRQFIYPFRVTAADTKDKISVNVLGVIRAHVTNPHKAAFGTDSWDQQLVNLTTNAVTNFTRSNNLDQVLTAKNKLDAQRLNKAIKDIKEDEEKYGIDIDGVDIIDISPNLKDEEKSKLYAEALAKSLGAATVIDGESRADAIRALNKANSEGGEFAVETVRAEAMVRAAEAAQGGTIILNSGGGAGNDPMQAAILAELKKLNTKR